MDMEARMFLHRGRVRPAAYAAELVNYMPSRVASLLDLGCGAGELALELAPRADLIVGLDLSGSLLAVAQARQAELGHTNVAWVMARAEAPPFRASSFDFVVSVNVLRLTDMPRTLERVRQMLKPGGRLALKDHLKTAEPLGFWVSYVARLARYSPSWIRHNGLSSWFQMLRYRLSPTGVAQSKLSESLTETAFVQVCEATLPDANVKTNAGAGIVLWQQSAVGNSAAVR